MPRTHFFTDGGALCGTLAVVEWTEDQAEVTCHQCLALMPLSPEERRQAVYGRPAGEPDGEGDPQDR